MSYNEILENIQKDIKVCLDKIGNRKYLSDDSSLEFSKGLYTLITNKNKHSKYYVISIKDNKAVLEGYTGFNTPAEAKEDGLISYYEYVLICLSIIHYNLERIKEV